MQAQTYKKVIGYGQAIGHSILGWGYLSTPVPLSVAPEDVSCCNTLVFRFYFSHSPAYWSEKLSSNVDKFSIIKSVISIITGFHVELTNDQHDYYTMGSFSLLCKS